MDSNDIDRLQGLQYFVEFVRRPLLARAEAAERRVAELEARLAEQEWRPVTGDMAAGHYLVFNENEPQLSEVMELVYNDILRQWYIPNGYDDIMPAPTHWRPLPPPPQDS